MTKNALPTTISPVYPQGTVPPTWKSTAYVPPIYSVITFADRTKTISSTATGFGDGSDADPWTPGQWRVGAVPGDVGGWLGGVYIGTQTAGDDGAKRYSPAFMVNTSGTEELPIYNVAENFAVFTETNRTELRSGATVSGDGWPAFGNLTKNWVYWLGFYSDESATDNKPRNDAGPTTFWSCIGGGLRYCDIRGEDVTFSDNHSGVRLENCSGFVVQDNNIYNFRVSGLGAVNQAGVLTYGCNNCDISYNEIDLCGNNIFWKAGTPQYGMTAHHNILTRGVDAIRIQLLTDTVRNAIYQNKIEEYGSSAVYFAQTAVPQDMPQNLAVVNNLIGNSTTVGGNLGPFRYDHVDYASANNFVRNNIIYNTNGSPVITSDFLTDVNIIVNFTHHDYNCYYEYGAAFGGSNAGAGTLRSLTVSDWETVHGMDANSVFADPLFVSESDRRLQAGSPCLNTGVDILQLQGGADTDSVNMGAYITDSETFGIRALV